MHAKNACSNAFSTFCVHLCGFEIQYQHLVWRYFSVKRNVMLQKMEVANAIFHYELEHLWYCFVSIMERWCWQIPLLRPALFYCQENSEFWCHEKARFLKKMFSWANTRKMSIFGKCWVSISSVFFTFHSIVKAMQWPRQSYGMSLAELCF